MKDFCVEKMLEEGVTSVREWSPGIYVVHTARVEENLKERVRNGEINSGTNVFVPDYVKELNEKYHDAIEEANRSFKDRKNGTR